MLNIKNFINSINIVDTELVNPDIYTICKELFNLKADGIRLKFTLNRKNPEDILTLCKYINSDKDNNKDKVSNILDIVDIFEFNLDNNILLAPYSYNYLTQLENNDLFVELPFPNNEIILFSTVGLMYSKLKIKLKKKINENNYDFTFNAIFLNTEFRNKLYNQPSINEHNCFFNGGKYYYKESNTKTIPDNEYTEKDKFVNNIYTGKVISLY